MKALLFACVLGVASVAHAYYPIYYGYGGYLRPPIYNYYYTPPCIPFYGSSRILFRHDGGADFFFFNPDGSGEIYRSDGGVDFFF